MPWRVTYYEEGEEPYSDEMPRFTDVWRLAMPMADGLVWTKLRRYDVESKFANDENHICVCWAGQDTRTVITKFNE